jgi:hypothetical protein
VTLHAQRIVVRSSVAHWLQKREPATLSVPHFKQSIGLPTEAKRLTRFLYHAGAPKGIANQAGRSQPIQVMLVETGCFQSIWRRPSNEVPKVCLIFMRPLAFMIFLVLFITRSFIQRSARRPTVSRGPRGSTVSEIRIRSHREARRYQRP